MARWLHHPSHGRAANPKAPPSPEGMASALPWKVKDTISQIRCQPPSRLTPRASTILAAMKQAPASQDLWEFSYWQSSRGVPVSPYHAPPQRSIHRPEPPLPKPVGRPEAGTLENSQKRAAIREVSSPGPELGNGASEIKRLLSER